MAPGSRLSCQASDVMRPGGQSVPESERQTCWCRPQPVHVHVVPGTVLHQSPHCWCLCRRWTTFLVAGSPKPVPCRESPSADVKAEAAFRCRRFLWHRSWATRNQQSSSPPSQTSTKRGLLEYSPRYSMAVNGLWTASASLSLFPARERSDHLAAWLHGPGRTVGYQAPLPHFTLWS